MKMSKGFFFFIEEKELKLCSELFQGKEAVI
jgi:hypothetical protein